MRLLSVLSGIIMSSLITTYAGGMTIEERQTAKLCASATQLIETKLSVPDGLLGAIALKETGRWDASRNQSFPWPWTITAEGKGRYFKNKKEALKAIQDLKNRNIHNIDIGCMQVNLWYHPHAFDSLENALDPNTNTNYAAEFLRQLKEDYQSWSAAVERYHSNDPKRGRQYRKTVYRLKFSSPNNSINDAPPHQTRASKTRQEILKEEFLDARTFRLESARRLKQAKAEQKIRLRKAFEKRKAKVLRKWRKMLQKRRQQPRSNTQPS